MNVKGLPMPTRTAYYRTTAGDQPVKDFIQGRNARERVSIRQAIQLLDGPPDNSPPPAFPVTSQVADHLRELRCHYGGTHFRILYRRSGNIILLLHALVKGSRLIPAQDIAIAQQYWDDFEARMNAQPRVPPRAIGQDALPRPKSSTSRRDGE
jgi:phage-related protein